MPSVRMDDAVTSNKCMILTPNTKIQRILSSEIKSNFCKFLCEFGLAFSLPSFFQGSIIDANTKNESWNAYLFADFVFCQQRVTVGQRGNIYCWFFYSVFVCVSKKSKQTFPNQNFWGLNWHQTTGKSKRNHKKPSVKSPDFKLNFQLDNFLKEVLCIYKTTLFKMELQTLDRIPVSLEPIANKKVKF
jgi:hypothetical protein